MPPKQAVLWVLLAVVVIAASVKSYSLYYTTIDNPEMRPQTIAEGRAHAPNQYRLLVPLLWRGATSLHLGSEFAERAIVLFSILFCYAALAGATYASSRSVPIAALCLIAFYGAAASGFWFRYRDVFFETGFTCIGMTLVVQPRPRWTPYAALSAVAALNRESWLFSLMGAGVWSWATAGGLRALVTERRRDAAGLAVAGAIAVAVLVATHAIYGVRAYHYEMWQYPNNFKLLLVGGSFVRWLGQAVWFAGSGLFAVWLAFAIAGRARYVPFVLGFTLSLLAVSFVISNWAETRIFIPAYAVMLISIGGGIPRS